MYSLYEVFLAAAVLSALAAFLAHKHGKKQGSLVGFAAGLKKGLDVGSKAALAALAKQLKAQGINLIIGKCECAECVASREENAP
jgi:hypothetical protein